MVNEAVTMPASPGLITPFVKSEIVQLQPGSTNLNSIFDGPRFDNINFVMAGFGAGTYPKS